MPVQQPQARNLQRRPRDREAAPLPQVAAERYEFVEGLFDGITDQVMHNVADPLSGPWAAKRRSG